VKLLRRELLADAVQVQRFIREARASAAIESPHVVRVLDAATEPLPYLATERLHGHTLSDLLRREGRLGNDATLELCRHVAGAIDAAAAAGIVHRDLKPQNLMRHDGAWKVLDFGVAAFSGGDASDGLTRGDAVGTPHYMSPEQAQGKAVDHRTDVYALGAIIYRCVTGRHAFDAGDTPSLLYAVVHRMPVRPGALAEVPEDFDRWCAIVLAKSPGDRFATGEALADALSDALAGTLDGKLRARADSLVRKHGWEAE
jgi:serine/threonine-protein kinase